MGEAESTETPYALAARLEREGAPSDAIRQALLARGVASEDIPALLAALEGRRSDERSQKLRQHEMSLDVEAAMDRYTVARGAKASAINLALFFGIGTLGIGVLCSMAGLMKPVIPCIGSGISLLFSSFAIRFRQTHAHAAIAMTSAGPLSPFLQPPHCQPTEISFA